MRHFRHLCTQNIEYRSIRFWTHLHIFLSVHNLELMMTLVIQQGVHEQGAHRLTGTKVDTTTIHCLITVQHQPQTQQQKRQRTLCSV